MCYCHKNVKFSLLFYQNLAISHLMIIDEEDTELLDIRKESRGTCEPSEKLHMGKGNHKPVCTLLGNSVFTCIQGEEDCFEFTFETGKWNRSL